MRNAHRQFREFGVAPDQQLSRRIAVGATIRPGVAIADRRPARLRIGIGIAIGMGHRRLVVGSAQLVANVVPLGGEAVTATRHGFDHAAIVAECTAQLRDERMHAMRHDGRHRPQALLK
ncbi:hypothetical protein, partial [Burkholderia sp.]|uniref:hypothetical protein n=1 Tax=Burkholderia sp. TaxID=36773 RepID=UPI0025866395